MAVTFRNIHYYLLSSASALLLASAFLLPVLFPLAWISFVPLFWVLQRAGKLRQAFFLGLLMGAVANLFGFYWLNYTIRVFGGFSHGLSVVIFFFFAAYAALPVAFFALLVRLCGLGPLNLFPPVFWVAIEFLFPHLFPWYLANSQAGFLTLIQSADLVGPYGTSFLLIWANGVIYHALSRYRDGVPIALRPLFAVALLVVVVLLYGYLRLETVGAQMRVAPKLVVAAVQGNIGVGLKWDPERAAKNLSSHKELTRRVSTASLVIWPETAVEAWVPENLRQLPQEILPSPLGMSFFIFGARSYRGDFGAADSRFFNSAFLADGEGRILGFYHKQILLAFGEYIPFSRLLSKLPGLASLGPGFSEGEGPHTLDLPEGSRVAPLICYEDLMPSLARSFVSQKGAHLLVNLTNDAWYGDSAAPWQHARLARWRAIETRRALVRATNTGVTTMINPKGEMVKSLPVFSPGVLTGKVEIMEGETAYVRFGDWFAWTNVLLAVGILLRRWSLSRRRH